MAPILICEFMDERAVARLGAQHPVRYEPDLHKDAAALLRTAAAGCQALIVRNLTQVRGDLLAALGRSGRCKAIGRLGVGLDNIDVAGCEALGMAVLPATGANAQSVAEYVMTSALLLLRGAYGCTDAVAAGLWPRAAVSNGREIAGQTLGIIGFGAIGQLTARLARSLGMGPVLAFDALLSPDAPVFAQCGVEPAALDTVIASADVLSLHVPLVESTRGLLNAARIARMKPGAILINTSRGHIVDLQAVASALRAGHLGGAAIDVFDTEPMPADAALQQCPRLLLTPHISGLSVQSNERVSFMVADRVLEVLKGIGTSAAPA
jgi:(S)-sulfolactate dehydrogenase